MTTETALETTVADTETLGANPSPNTPTPTKLYVGSLPYTWAAEQLEEIFKPYGTIASVAIVADQTTHRSKGFGFVEFESADVAKKAMSELNGREIEGRNISVREARPHTERSNSERPSNTQRSQNRERTFVPQDNSESTDTSGRTYGNRRGWW